MRIDAKSAEQGTDRSVPLANKRERSRVLLGEKNNTTALDRDDGSKVVLIKNGYGAVSLSFSIFPEGSGSRIEYRKQFGTIGGAWKQCVGLKPAK